MIETSLPSVDGVTHRDVDVGGVRLHVAEAGDGPVLVLLHGWPQHWWCWRRLMPMLAREHRVLAPDLRGFGWSDAGSSTPKASIGSASSVTTGAGTRRPARARAPGPRRAPPRPPRRAAVASGRATAAEPPRRPALASYQLLLGAPGVGRWTDAELDVYADVLRDPARAEASSACYRTFLTRELPAMLLGGDRSDELETPSLLAMGETSPVRRILRQLPGPNLRVETIASAGHFLPEAPGDVLRIARAWFG